MSSAGALERVAKLGILEAGIMIMAVWTAGALVMLYVLHRLAVWMEMRGWIY
jgi:hypothetical protein